MMFVVKGQDILTVRDPWTEREVEEIKNGLADGEKLVASGDLDSDELYKHLEDVPSWDDETVEPVARELCDRFGVEYGGDMDDLMPKLWEAMSWRSEDLGEAGLWVDSEVGRSRLLGRGADDERALWLQQSGQWRDRM